MQSILPVVLLSLCLAVGCGRLGYEGSLVTDGDGMVPSDADGAVVPDADGAVPLDGGPEPVGDGPLALDYGRTWAILAHGREMQPLSPTIVGEPGVFTVSPALPDGLSLDHATGIISGTPPSRVLATTFTISATGERRSASFDLRLDLRPAIDVDSAADLPDANPGDGLCDTGTGACTLRAAIEEGGTATGPLVVLLPRDTYAVGAELQMGGDVALVGAGQGATIIDGQLLTRAIKIADPGTNVYVSDLGIRRGSSSGGSGVEVHLEATAHLSNVTLSENVLAPDGGGGLKVTGSSRCLLEYSTIADNVSDGGGGGMAVVNATADIYRARFVNNSASGRGGGLLSFGSETTVTVESSHFLGNAADVVGGAICTTYSSAMVAINSTFVDNSATVGGAVANTSFETPRLELIHCTMVGSAAVEALQGGAGTELSLRNSIIATGSAAPCAGGGVVSRGGNLAAMDASSCGIPIDDSDRHGVDPRLSSEGASLPTPGSGSPALDALATESCGAAVDALGLPRPLDADGDGDAACDIGAIEALPASSG